MTGNKIEDMKTAAKLAVELAAWCAAQIECGADMGLLGTALMGVGADLLARSQGARTARVAFEQLAADIESVPEDGGHVH